MHFGDDNNKYLLNNVSVKIKLVKDLNKIKAQKVLAVIVIV